MKDTIYFRHDYDAHSDPKIIKLRMKFGREGYGIFWALIEIMRTDSEIIIKDCELDAIAFRLQCDYVLLNHIIMFLLEVGLFQEDNGAYYSERLQSDVEYMREKSNKAKASADARRKRKPKKDANALQTQSESNAIKDSTVDESTVEKIIENDIIKEKTPKTPIGVPVSKKPTSIINKHNKADAIALYDKIKEICTVVDGDLSDCVVLHSKLKLYGGSPPENLGIIIQKMKDTGLSKFYSISSPGKLADNLGTIVEKIKAESAKNKVVSGKGVI